MSNLDQLDQGWFACYKIALCLDSLFRGWMIGNAYSIFFLKSRRPMTRENYKTVILNLIPLALDVFQFIAMKARDLATARIALTGHLCVLGISVVSLLNYAFFYRYVKDKVLIFERLVLMALYGGMVVFGSFKADQFLSANKI